MAHKHKAKKSKQPAKAAPEKEPANAPVGPKQPSLWWALIPALLGFVLYANTFGHDYTLDDFTIIVEHSHVKSGVEGIDEIMTTNYRHGMGGFNDGLYRPLSLVTFALEEEFLGTGAKSKHIINALLYALTGFFLFLLGRRLFPQGGNLLPLILALVCIAHPVHTEGVASVKGRDEVMGFLFFVLAAMAYFDAARRNSIGKLLLGTLFYALAFLSKESSITYAAGIPVLLYFFGRFDLKTMAQPIAALGAATGALLAWRYKVLSALENPVDEGIFGLMNNSLFGTDNQLERLATAAWMQVMYLERLVMPVTLSHDYSYNAIPVVGLGHWKAIVGVLVVVGLLFWAIRGIKNRDHISASILFYFISISVAANVFFMNGATFAERFAYTPAFAMALALAVLLQRLGKFNGTEDVTALPKAPVVAGIVGAVVLFFSYQTVVRNVDWKDNLTLYAADIDKIPGSARGHYNLGSENFQTAQTMPESPKRQQMLTLAVGELKQSVAILPDYLDAWNNLALTYKLQNNLDSAVVTFQHLTSIAPQYTKGWYNRATVHVARKEYQAAIDCMHQYTNSHPNLANAWFVSGEAYGFLGQYENAIVDLKRCIAADPNHYSGTYLLGQAHGLLQDHAGALSYFAKSAQLKPQNPDVWFNIGITHSMMGNFPEAITNLEHCVKLAPNHTGALNSISQAYSAMGNVAKANEYQQRAAQQQ